MLGHAEKWDEIAVDGNIAAKDCLLRYKSGDGVLRWLRSIAMAQSLEAELAMERGTRWISFR